MELPGRVFRSLKLILVYFILELLHSSFSLVGQPGVNDERQGLLSVGSQATGKQCAMCPNCEDGSEYKIWIRFGNTDKLLYQSDKTKKGIKTCYETSLKSWVPCMHNGIMLYPVETNDDGTYDFEGNGMSVMSAVKPMACPSLDDIMTSGAFNNGHRTTAFLSLDPNVTSAAFNNRHISWVGLAVAGVVAVVVAAFAI